MIAFVLRYWYLAVIAALLAAVGIQQVRINNAHTAFAEYKLEQAQLTQAAEKAAREREQSLQKQAATIEEAKDEQIRIIGDQLDTALASLSKRPSRPAGNVPSNSANCKGSTGAGLFRPDAEFLARLAARADVIAKERDACIQQYEALRK